MRSYKGYLMVSDLDGTLINSSHEISKYNLDAISDYTEKGGLFAVATGRTEINVKPFIKGIRINCPCILYNGAIIYDLGEQQFIKCVFLDHKYLLEPLKEILSEYRSLCMQIFIQGKMLVVSGETSMDPVVIRENQPYEFAYIDSLVNENWIKIILKDSHEVLLDIQHFLHNRIPPGIITSVFSTSTYLEILSYGVSKGSALSDLMNTMNVDNEKVVAIGDYCNDIEMVRTAGLGVATANAHHALKEAANITTVSNDEHAIHTLINKVIPEYNRTLSDSKNREIPISHKGYGSFSV